MSGFRLGRHGTAREALAGSRVLLKHRPGLMLVLLLAAPLLQAQFFLYNTPHTRLITMKGLTALLPDPQATPGVARPEANLEEVCHGGSTKQFRHTTAAMKAEVYKLYGAQKVPGVCCEVDHLISLELGGADDVKNLWPEPYEPRPGAHEKDTVENYLHARVCAGKMNLADAQAAIRVNWLAVYVNMPHAK